MLPVSDLIDTTQMYLRTIFELEEEGVVPLRARIAERLGQSGPTVSQTVARMARDGLLTVEGDRQLQLTDLGRTEATRVMRKHRLAECLLVDVIGLPWQEVHAEACRWEHVISETVELRLLDVLGNPTESPFGNPIPGLDELRSHESGGRESEPSGDRLPHQAGSMTLDVALTLGVGSVRVRHIGEPLQADAEAMNRVHQAGIVPGRVVALEPARAGVLVGESERQAQFSILEASYIVVERVK